MELFEQLVRPQAAPSSLSPSRTRPALPSPAPTPPVLSCVVATEIAQAETVRPAWTDLLERSGRSELTQTPTWLLSWWAVFGPQQGRQLRLALFRQSGRLVGVAPLLRRRHWYRGALPFRRLELLGSGERDGHGIFSNHLGVIAEPGAEHAVARRLVASLIDGEFGAWDEIVLPMMDGDGPMPYILAGAFRDAGLSAEIAETARAPFIALPSTWDEYLARLSGTHRRQVTRALRGFDEWAGTEVRLERADDPATLEKGKRVLVELHQARWKADRRSGVFRLPSYLQFHDTMMRTLLDQRALELVWLSVRGEPVAALYGMRWRDKVYAYQMGRRPNLPPAVRPGMVILAHAIRAAIESGYRELDLLADEAPYKLQLASATRVLVQVRAVRAGLRECTRLLAQRCWDGLRAGGRTARRLIAPRPRPQGLRGRETPSD